MNLPDHDHIQGSINRAKLRIEKGKPKLKKGKTTTTMRKDLGVESKEGLSLEVQKKCEKANRASRTPLSNMRRERSIDKRNNLNVGQDEAS